QRALSAATPLAATAKVGSSDVTWLLGAQREYPFEMPDMRELTRWYLFSLSALAAAGLIVGVTHGVSRFCCGGWSSRLPAGVVFWIGLLALGLITTPLANRHWSH